MAAPGKDCRGDRADRQTLPGLGRHPRQSPLARESYRHRAGPPPWHDPCFGAGNGIIPVTRAPIRKSGTVQAWHRIC